MIKEFDFKKDNPYEDEKISDLGEELARYQRKMIDHNLPVMIYIEGWESSGHSLVLNDLIKELNPRNYRVNEYSYQDNLDTKKPPLWNYWRLIPKKGDMSLLDRSYYYALFNDLNISDKRLDHRLDLISSFEKQQTDDNMLILKFFLHVKKKEHRKRLEKLKEDEHRSFFITDTDEKQYKHYNKYEKHMDKIIEKSNFDFAPWTIINAQDLKDAAREIIALTTYAIEQKIQQLDKQQPFTRQPYEGPRPLNNLDLSHSVDEGEYDKKLDELQEEIADLTYQLYLHKVPTILVFEGMDAAGKGGAIERLTRSMDARFYNVMSISAPTKLELAHHYLWRFYKEFPDRGLATIFDRSWYGRVLVERIEGFATKQEWNRAYDEINDMEEKLTSAGAFVLKFFIVIDKNEQLIRFEDRQKDEDKVYKITEEDWRNREKWNDYLDAMNEMLGRTDTTNAPWIIVEGNDKKFARLKVLRTFIKYAKAHLKNLK